MGVMKSGRTHAGLGEQSLPGSVIDSWVNGQTIRLAEDQV
jgi:hypothetical protein